MHRSCQLFASRSTPLRLRRVCVVQGASRGLGLELTRQLAERGDVVFATCRTPSAAVDLSNLQAQSPGSIVMLPLDVTDAASISGAAQQIAIHPLAAADNIQGGTVDLLLNTSGVLQDRSQGLVPERSLAHIGATAALFWIQ